MENVKFCAKFSSFARRLTTLFYFKENRCWKSSYSCESLWWTCFIRNNVQRLILTFQKWWFRPQEQRPWKTTEINWRCRIAGIAGRRLNSNTKIIGKSIGSWPGNYFQTLINAIGNIQKEGKRVPYELKERDIERRKTTCEILFDCFKRKSFWHRIVTGDEKWIYFDNPKREKSWVDPGQPSTSQPLRNIHGKKALMRI